MAYVVSFEGERCPQGAELVMVESRGSRPLPFESAAPAAPAAAIPSDSSGLPIIPLVNGSWPFSPPPYAALLYAADPGAPPLGPVVRFKSEARERYTWRLEGMRNSLVQKFMTCRPAAETPKDLLAFVAEFGMPTWTTKSSQPPGMLLKEIDAFRQAFVSGLEMFHAGYVSESMQLLRPDMEFSDLRPVLTLPRGTRRPTLGLVAADLAGFMVLEFGCIIAGDPVILRCGHCATLFIVGPTTGRRNTALYCCNRCRVAHQRARPKTPGKPAHSEAYL